MSSPTKVRDWTLRVEGIPIGTTQGTLETNLRSLEGSSTLKSALTNVVVRSLCPKSSSHCSATVVLTTDSPLEALIQDFNKASTSQLGYRLDNFFDGITPLLEDKDGAACDIVAVPGLNGHALASWKTRGKNDVWLRDWLPKHVPKIRVLLYGYDSRLQKSTSFASIEDLSKAFLEDLTTFRRGTGTAKRPIIFLGHSLGGLLVKEALFQSLDSAENKIYHRYLHEACCGMVFFGVPHAGIRLQRLPAIMKGKPNEELVRSIVTNSESEPSAYLKKLTKGFAKSFHGETRVISIFEKNASPLLVETADGRLEESEELQLLVTEASATNTGLTGAKLEDIIPFATNHSDLTKFEWAGHRLYELTRDRIQDLVDAAAERKEQLMLEAPEERRERPINIVQEGSKFGGQYNVSGGGNFSQGNNMTNNF